MNGLPLRLSRSFPFLVLSVALPVLSAYSQSAIDQHLRDQYLHKAFILRGFYAGNSLHYDAAGVSPEERNAGDWTTDGVVRIDDIRISGNRLLIRGSRVYLGWVPDVGLTEIQDITTRAKADKHTRVVRIEAELGPGAGTDDAADAAFGHAFLTSQDDFVDLVPDYWKRCVRTALGIAKDREASRCQFSPDFLAIPGVAAHTDSTAATESEPVTAQELGHYRPREGQKPPRAIYQPGPEYSDPARRAKFQGVVTLKLVVDEEGRPSQIRILNPLGCGLDAKAVQAVENWKFAPGEKDGQPVATGIAVEVSFHLY
jgi:TonB family protein